MLELSEKGDNAGVDMLVGDICERVYLLSMPDTIRRFELMLDLWAS